MIDAVLCEKLDAFGLTPPWEVAGTFPEMLQTVYGSLTIGNHPTVV